MQTIPEKIFKDRPYYLDGFVILKLIYEYESYPSRILLRCDHPDYEGFRIFWLTIPVDQFEQLIPFLGELGQKSFDNLKEKLESGEKDCEIKPRETFGEFLVCVNLVFVAKVIAIDSTFVDFEIDDITTGQEKNLIDGEHRPICNIAMDIHVLATKKGYEYGAMYDYLPAMMSLQTMDDTYGQDRASYIVKAFIGNIQYWKIDEIKPLRTELKKLIADYDN